MHAWLWVANPERKWNEASGLSPWEALHQYLSGEYVYWSTPAHQRDISGGDRAYIWQSKAGIVVAGEVGETPQEYNGHNAHIFAHQDRLEAAGWNEANATSRWKTGIVIQRRFLDRPLNVQRLFERWGGLGAPTILPLNEGEHRSIIIAIQERDVANAR